MTFGVAPPPPPPPGGFNIPLAALGVTSGRPHEKGFTLAQEPGIVAEAIRDAKVDIYHRRDRVLDLVLEPYLQMKKAWWCPWVKRFADRTEALVHLEENPDEAYTAAATYGQDHIEKLENIEDRLSAAEFRSQGIGIIIPNSEFALIEGYYENLGGVHADGTQYVVAAAKELKDKLSLKRPKTQRPPKPEPRQSILAKGRRNLDLDE